ncbi:MAG: hypothetical protein GXY61_05445 [Lentisphaerae bacterium]|nr:hypothetical protein [Lentisphaerota bacterium]
MNKMFLLFVLIITATGCGEKKEPDAVSQEPAPEGSKLVLLAYEDTEFKDALILKMKELLEKDEIVVRIGKHNSAGLAVSNPSVFDAIFISNSGVNSQVRPWITAWIEDHKAYKDVILLHTSQNSAWSVNALVDTVTSASDINSVEKLAAEYTDKLKAIYSKNP